MSQWDGLIYSEAQQITRTMGAKSHPDTGVTPEQYFRALLARDGADAIAFLAHALDHYQTIAWCHRALIRFGPDPDSYTASAGGSLVKAWLGAPADDDIRRRAQDVAETYAEPVPEKLLLFAVFMSGNSIAPIGLDKVPPPAGAAPRLVFAALLALAAQFSDGEALIDSIAQLGQTFIGHAPPNQSVQPSSQNA